MKTTLTIYLLCMIFAGATFSAFSQSTKANTKKEISMKSTMNTYVIEREIPDAGKLNAGDLQGIAQKSCVVLKELGPDIEWVQSYVTDNRVFCIYRAKDEAMLRTHAMKAGFPINSVHLLSSMISPATATADLAEIK